MRKARIQIMVAAISGVCVSAAIAQTPIALWSMDPTGGNRPATLDSRTSAGQGTLIGLAPVAPAFDHLTTFNGLPVTDEFVTSADVPPSSMFNAANPLVPGAIPGSFSYDAAAIRDVNGALVYEVGEYGSEFDFTGSFTVECFFKTDGDQICVGKQQILYTSEGPYRFGLVIGESAPGGIRFSVRDGSDVFALADINTQNYSDGEWHYVLAECDLGAMELRLTVTDEDGTGESVTTALPPGFALSLSPDGSNMLIGRFKFPIDDPQDRTFIGKLDEIQITNGIVSATDRLGNLPNGDAPDDPGPAAESVIARWSMTEIDRPGVVLVVEDGRKATADERGPQHLWTFSDLPVIDDSIFRTSSDVPPAALFDNGNDGGMDSFDASSLAAVNGALLYPRDVYGDIMSFTGAFSIEAFFKTNGDQSAAGPLQLILQGENFFRYGIILNESGAGEVRFAINDGLGQVPTLDLAQRNYADGEWHYVLASYDPSVGANGQLSLQISSLDGPDVVTDSATLDIDGLFAGLPVGDDGGMFIGRNTFPVGDDPRTFLGLIDEVQVSLGVVADSERLGVVDDCIADFNGDGTVNGIDVGAFLAAYSTFDPANGADLNNDGNVNGIDVGLFLSAFAAGC